MSPSLIAGRSLDPTQPAWIIAEIGVNHDGSVQRAEALVRLAAQCGADAVKIQCFRSESLAAPGAPLSDYQADGVMADQQALLKSLELPESCWASLKSVAEQNNIELFGSPFDEESLSALLRLGVRVIKLGSGELTNVPLLRAAARTRLPLILSTGMATWDEIDFAVDLVHSEAAQKPWLLHCVSLYPTPESLANVRALTALAERTSCGVGYSDHTASDEASLAARALDACILERHLTDDRQRSGPDHSASLDGAQFRTWVQRVRRLESTLGSGHKVKDEAQQENRYKVRRGIALRCDVSQGEVLTDAHLITLRPAHGIEARYYDSVVGQRVTRELPRGSFLSEADLEGEFPPYESAHSENSDVVSAPQLQSNIERDDSSRYAEDEVLFD